jgi:hypothetical protein
VAKANFNDSNSSNYVLATSNVISKRITDLTTDMIYEDVNANNKFIVNNKYNTNLLVNGDLTINSNLIVLGESTTLQTIVYTTERMEVVNDNNTAIALMIQQKDSNNAILVASNLTANVFTIANNGDVNIVGNYKKNNRNVIEDTSNYVLSTSNYLINYNNLINKPDLAASQVNSDWNAVSGVAQILNKPDLTIIATNNTNGSNYVQSTSNILVSKANFNDTNVSNYVLATSNYLINYNNLINKPDLAASQVNSDWNAVSGVSQILNKPDLTIIATNNTNGSNYVQSTSNILINRYNTQVFATAQIPSLDAAKITSGTFTTAQIPSLDAAKITSGTFATAQIPSLDAAKITTGTFATSQITGLDTALAAKQATINSTANQLIIGNGNGATTTSTGLTFNTSTSTLTATNFVGNGSGLTNLPSSQWTNVPSGIYYNTSNVGIGTISPAQKLHVIGDVAATGRVISYYSDERLKTNISKIYNSLEIINNINGFYYEPNNIATSLGIKNRGREIGLSAQDVNRFVPEVISLAPVDICRDANNDLVSKSGSNYLTINYERLIPILVESIKELNMQITHLKKENDEFRAFKEKVSNIMNINQ